MLLLGIITTAIGHTLFLRGLNYYSATTASILACIVPVYGLSLGYLVLGEEMTSRTIIGSGIILSVVVVKALDKGKSVDQKVK